MGPEVLVSVALAQLQCCLFGGFTAQPVFQNYCPAAHTGGKLAERKMSLLILFREEFTILEAGE